MTSDCDNLDAYLSDDLPAAPTKQFAVHLTQCESCRDAVAEQCWIDHLLRSNVRASLDPVPQSLRNTLRAPTPRRHSTRLIACGLAAAAIVIVATSLALNKTGPTTNSRQRATSDIASTEPSTNHTAPPAATFVSNGDTIAVPLESADDNVTIVQLYPTTVTERRTRLELVLQLTDPQSDGG